jgi:hypothetical protein
MGLYRLFRHLYTMLQQLKKKMSAFLTPGDCSAIPRGQKPGFPLQFLSPLRGLRDFRCNPWRPKG